MEFGFIGFLLVFSGISLVCGSAEADPLGICAIIGGLCQKSADCCRGCCEGNLCVDRNFSCSGDLVAIPGGPTCTSTSCRPGELCYLTEFCPPENPCAERPRCRKVPGPGYQPRNYSRNSAAPLKSPVSTTTFTFAVFTASSILFLQT